MLTITYKLAMSAGLDAGNRSMKQGGRSEWNEQDWNAAADEFARVHCDLPRPTHGLRFSDRRVSE